MCDLQNTAHTLVDLFEYSHNTLIVHISKCNSDNANTLDHIVDFLFRSWDGDSFIA